MTKTKTPKQSFQAFKKSFNYFDRYKDKRWFSSANLYAFGSSLLLWLFSLGSALSAINFLKNKTVFFSHFVIYLKAALSFIPIPLPILTLIVLGVVLAALIAKFHFHLTVEYLAQAVHTHKEKPQFMIYKLASRIKILATYKIPLPQNFLKIVAKNRVKQNSSLFSNIWFAIISISTLVTWYNPVSTYFGLKFSWYSTVPLFHLPFLSFISPLVIAVCFIITVLAVKIFVERIANTNNTAHFQGQEALMVELRSAKRNLNTVIQAQSCLEAKEALGTQIDKERGIIKEHKESKKTVRTSDSHNWLKKIISKFKKMVSNFIDSGKTDGNDTPRQCSESCLNKVVDDADYKELTTFLDLSDDYNPQSSSLDACAGSPNFVKDALYHYLVFIQSNGKMKPEGYPASVTPDRATVSST